MKEDERLSAKEMWVSVEDELPAEGETVLVFTENGAVAFGMYMHDLWEAEGPPWDDSCTYSEVTHWRELPEWPMKGINIRDS